MQRNLLHDMALTWKQKDVLMARIRALVATRERQAIRGIADWYEETFCPRSGVLGDERHARGDCDHCNIAKAILNAGRGVGENR